jgi:hypothetical protein
VPLALRVVSTLAVGALLRPRALTGQITRVSIVVAVVAGRLGVVHSVVWIAVSLVAVIVVVVVIVVTVWVAILVVAAVSVTGAGNIPDEVGLMSMGASIRALAGVGHSLLCAHPHVRSLGARAIPLGRKKRRTAGSRLVLLAVSLAHRRETVHDGQESERAVSVMSVHGRGEHRRCVRRRRG